jgi:hypothetical protein
MSDNVLIKDVTKELLAFDEFMRRRLSPFYEFFQFWCYPRVFTRPEILAGCRVYSITVAERATSVTFESVFPKMLTALVENDLLHLHVKSTDLDYFDESRFIPEVLVPGGNEFVLLSNQCRQRNPQLLDVGALIFEWPIKDANQITEWFMSPQVHVEAYVAQARRLGEIAQLYFMPDTEERLKNLLRLIDFGINLWPDNDGMYLLSDKLSLSDIEGRLN